jgi:hypothetical protein
MSVVSAEVVKGRPTVWSADRASATLSGIRSEQS